MIVNSSRNSNSNNNGNSISNSKSQVLVLVIVMVMDLIVVVAGKCKKSLSVTVMVVVILNVIVMDAVIAEAIAEVADLARVKSYKMWVFEGGVPYIYTYMCGPRWNCKAAAKPL